MTLNVGLIGCGNISDIYLGNGPLFRDIAFTSCADLDPAAARRQAERYGLAPRSVADLLASPDVDIVLNLTIPSAHAEVSLAALAAGKHVYSEKPLATTLDDGRKLPHWPGTGAYGSERHPIPCSAPVFRKPAVSSTRVRSVSR